MLCAHSLSNTLYSVTFRGGLSHILLVKWYWSRSEKFTWLSGLFITLSQDVKKTPERLYNTSFAIYPQRIPLGQLLRPWRKWMVPGSFRLPDLRT